MVGWEHGPEVGWSWRWNWGVDGDENLLLLLDEGVHVGVVLVGEEWCCDWDVGADVGMNVGVGVGVHEDVGVDDCCSLQRGEEGAMDW